MIEAKGSNSTGAIWHYDQNSYVFSRTRTKNGTTYTTHYDVCCADAKYDVFRLIEAIDLIFFDKDHATLTQAPQEKRLEVLQRQGYPLDLAEQIVNFLAAPPTNAKAVSAFFNGIKHRTPSS